MRVEFIGTGDGRGIPSPGCRCRICREAEINREVRRTPPCVVLSSATGSLILDAGDPLLSQTLSRYRVDALLLSHFHEGHTHGLRRFTSDGANVVRVLAPPEHEIRQRLARENPQLEFEEVLPDKTYQAGDASITPIVLNHGTLTYGYLVEKGLSRIAYLCDTCGLSPHAEQRLGAWVPHVLLVDCCHPPDQPSSSHNTPEQAFAIHRRSGARESYLFHTSCAAVDWLQQNRSSVPDGVSLAYDGMVVTGEAQL